MVSLLQMWKSGWCDCLSAHLWGFGAENLSHLVRKKDSEHLPRDPGLPSKQLRGREELSRNPWALNNNLGEEEVGVEESALVYPQRKKKS